MSLIIDKLLYLIYKRKKINFSFSHNKKDFKMKSFLLWSHMGSNHGPPDYESGALTN